MYFKAAINPCFIHLMMCISWVFYSCSWIETEGLKQRRGADQPGVLTICADLIKNATTALIITLTLSSSLLDNYRCQKVARFIRTEELKGSVSDTSTCLQHFHFKTLI